MADLKSYPVPKVSHQFMKTPGPKGGNSEVKMKAPPRVGAQRNPGASPDPMFGREFSAEQDFGKLAKAKRVIREIEGNPARRAAAMAYGRTLKNVGGGPINERGPDGHQTARGGAPRRDNNSYDNRQRPSKPSTGVKMDGQKGRW